MSVTQSRIHPLVVPFQDLLTEAEEQELFRAWRAAPPGRAKEMLFRRIIEAFSPIVYKASRKYGGYGINQKDLVDEGVCALVDVANRFNPDLGWRFATYARTWVEGLLLAYIAKNYFPVNVCSSQKMKKIFFGLRKHMKAHFQDTGFADAGPEFFEHVATKMEVPVEDVRAMYAMFSRPAESFQDPISTGEEGGGTKGDLFADNAPSPEDMLTERSISAFHQKVVADAMALCLTQRERAVLMAQMVCEDDQQSTLQELGVKYNLSKERIRQIRETAMMKVTNYLTTVITDEERSDMFN